MCRSYCWCISFGVDMNTESKVLAVIPSSNQALMADDLMDELRQVINADKYNHMTIATVIGVLEMTKLHYWTVN
jgi:hypothetical protein